MRGLQGENVGQSVSFLFFEKFFLGFTENELARIEDFR